MVKTNIFKSRNIIPRHVQTYRIKTSSINIDFNDLESHIFNNGGYCFRQNEYTIFLLISEPSNEGIPIQSDWINQPLESFIWEVNDVNSLNKFKLCFNATFRKFIIQLNSNLRVSRRRPIIKENYSNTLSNEIETAKGLIYQPCLINERLGMIMHYRVFYPTGTLMNRELLSLSQLSPNNYFTRLNQFIQTHINDPLRFFVGEHEFSFNLANTYVQYDIDMFEVPFDDDEEILEELLETERNFLNKHSVDEEIEETSAIDLSSFKTYSNFKNPLVILPNNIAVGREQTSNWRLDQPLKPIWRYLKDFGPYQTLDLEKLWLIPVYDESHTEFRENVSKICTDLVNLSRYYRNPGLLAWLQNTEITVTDPIPLNIKGDIDAWLTRIIQAQQNQDGSFPDRFRQLNSFQAIFIINMPFTEEYFEIKRVLSYRGVPCQIISQVNINNRNYKYYRWNLLTSIYAKLGGKIWTIKARNPGRLNDINLVLGFRFKRPPGQDYITAIATVLTGLGEFMGYYAENFDIKRFQSSGMKLTEDQIRMILNNLHSQFLSDIDNPSILITRLGPMPSEERELFINYLNELNITNYGICTFSRVLLRLSTITGNYLPLGTFIEHNRKKATLIPIGNLQYTPGRTTQHLSNRISIPTTFYLELEVNKGLYIDNDRYTPIKSLAQDIMNLCWLNWQNVFFPIAGMPVTLSYAEKIANYFFHGIIANGELRNTLWFI